MLYRRLEVLIEVHPQRPEYLLRNEDYHIQKAFVLSNEHEIMHKGKIAYMPSYFVMFFQNGAMDESKPMIEINHQSVMRNKKHFQW